MGGVVVVAADKQLHRIFTLAARSGLTPRAATGRLKLTHRHALEIAGFGEQHAGTLVGDQVDVGEATAKIEDLRTARGRIPLAKLTKLVLNDAENTLTPAKNVLVVSNFGNKILMLQADFVGLQSCEAA